LTNLTNQPQLTNTQDQAATAAGNLTNGWNAAVGGLPAQPSVDAGSDDSLSIPIAGLGTMTIGMGFLAGYWSPVRQCIAWCTCISLFFAMLRYGEKAVADVLSQRQVQGSTEEIAGTNASAVSAVGYAVIISALLLSVPVALAAYFTNSHSLIASFAGGVTSLGGSPMWHMINLAMPMDVWISAFWSYVTFRYLIGIPLTLGIRVLILWLVN
jgi:hypothetical protein